MIRLPTLIACVALTSTFVGCNSSFSVSVVGSGNIERDERPVTSFKTIKLSGSGEVFIQKGDVDELAIETDDNLFPYIHTEVDGDELKIDFKRGYTLKSSQAIRFYLTVRNLEKINVSGSSDITIDDYDTDKLTLSISGSGKVNLSQFRAKELTIKIAGSGEIEARGQVDALKLSVAGSGKLRAFDLKAKSVDLNFAGSGNAEVSPVDSLAVSVAGSGDVVYRGEPGKVTQKISGSGSVKRVE